MATNYSESAITFGGLPCYDPRMLFQEAQRLGHHVGNWYGRANSFREVRGREPGRGWVLILKKYLSSSLTSSTQSLVLKYGNTTLVFTGLYVVQMTAILADGHVPSGETMYLVEFADPRIHFPMSIFDGELSNASWEGVVDELWSNLPASAGDFPGFPATYTPGAYTLPETFHLTATNTWDAILGILEMLSLDVAYNPFTGLFYLIDMAIEQADLKTQIADPELLARTNLTTAPYLSKVFYPETVRVYFLEGWASYSAFENGLLTTGPITLDAHYYDKATGITGASSGSFAALAYPIAESTDYTTGTLDAIADDIGARYASRLQWSVNCGYDQFIGLSSSPLPGSQLAEVRWMDLGWGMFTEFYGTNCTEAEWRKLHRPILAVSSDGGSDLIIGVLNEALVRGEHATVSVWKDGEDTNDDIEAYDWLMKSGESDIALGKKVICAKIDGTWYVVDAECP